jgi:hypothetical protein
MAPLLFLLGVLEVLVVVGLSPFLIVNLGGQAIPPLLLLLRIQTQPKEITVVPAELILIVLVVVAEVRVQ